MEPINRLKRDLQKQLQARKEELQRLKDCKEYMINNFEAEQSECDTVLDIIARVINRKEKQIAELKERIFLAM